MKLGVSISTNSQLAYARIAEEAGIEEFWIGDTFERDPFATAASILSETSKIRIGIGNTNPYSRHPGIIALSTATIAQISKKSRVILAVGSGGFSQLATLGYKVWNRPLEAVKESVVIIRQLLSGEECNFSGQLFHTVNARLQNPPDKSVPIYVSAIGPKMMRVASEVGDGVLIAALPLPLASGTVKNLRSSRKKQNANFEITVQIFGYISHQTDKANKSMKLFLARNLLLDPRFSESLSKVGYDQGKLDIVKKSLEKGKEEIIRNIDDGLLDAISLTGSPKDVATKIREYEKEGIQHLCIIPIADPSGQLELMRRYVVPNCTSKT